MRDHGFQVEQHLHHAREGQIATSTLLRDSPTTMNGIIMINDQKDPHIRVRWEKVAYDAKVDYQPPAQPRP